ncbi:hypothetical protein KKC52_08230 [bacterium]|nr:hypothetical protein [bacterium]
MPRLIKNLLRGAGSVINIWPNSNHQQKAYPHKSDAEALRQDWERIGRDFRCAIGKVTQDSEYKKK